MQEVVLVIHIMLALGIIILVLIQRSEGGGLGIGGGGGGMGNLATLQGTRNLLTRLTAIFAGCFFVTSLLLAVLASGGKDNSILDAAAPTTAPSQTNTTNDITENGEPPSQEAPSLPLQAPISE